MLFLTNYCMKKIKEGKKRFTVFRLMIIKFKVQTQKLYLNYSDYLPFGKSCSNRSSLPSSRNVRARPRGRDSFRLFLSSGAKGKHSRWVVNSYRQNTTTYNTKYLYILNGKASQSHRGPARLSVVPFHSFSSECRSLSICSAACIARLGINRILACAEFPALNFSRHTSRSAISRVHKSRRC